MFILLSVKQQGDRGQTIAWNNASCFFAKEIGYLAFYNFLIISYLIVFIPQMKIFGGNLFCFLSNFL